MNESPNKITNSQPYNSYNSINEYEAYDESDNLASSPPVNLKHSFGMNDSNLDYNQYMDNSSNQDKVNRKSYYEQMKTNKDQYNSELSKGLDKKHQSVPLS